MLCEMFSPIRNLRAAEEIEKQIKGAIFSQNLRPGDRLPSEKGLSETFNTSRTMVREALRALEKDGFITVKQGVKGGSYIREADFSPVVKSISHMLQLKKVSLENLTEARLTIEPEIAKMSALRSAKHDLKRMEEALNYLHNVVEKKERSTSTNILFHRVVGESCGNPVFYMMNSALADLLQDNLSRRELEPEHNRLFLQQHLRIYEAIKTRHAKKAYFEMRKHILSVYKAIKNP